VFSDKDYYVPEVELLPDGAVLVAEAGSKKLKYNV
jgi:hypothetical protein